MVKGRRRPRPACGRRASFFETSMTIYSHNEPTALVSSLTTYVVKSLVFHNVYQIILDTILHPAAVKPHPHHCAHMCFCVLEWVGVTVKPPGFAVNLLLHGRTTHPAVLINTNGWHGYGELKSGVCKRVLDAINFVTRLRSRRGGWRGLFTPRKPP